MVGMIVKKQSHWWWFEGHSNPKRSPWLQSTLSELDEKTQKMLKMIEEDADSFAQRAEMFYKKRPELISLVEDFYRTHRSLAERFDLLKSESGTRLTTPLGSPRAFTKLKQERFSTILDQCYDSCSDNFDPEDSEVDDPELEENADQDATGEMERDEISDKVDNEEMRKLRQEIERLREENRVQKDQLLQKDEEKREVIRQLSLAVDMLKDENLNLKKYIGTSESTPKKRNPLELNKLKELFFGKLFSGGPSSKPETTAIPL